MMTSTVQATAQAINTAAPLIRPKTSRDDKIMIGYMLVVGLYLIIALALPLYTMLSKSVSTFYFDLNNFEFQVNNGDGWSAPVTAFTLNEELKTEKLQAVQPEQLTTSSDGRLAATVFSRTSVFAARPNTEFANSIPIAPFWSAVSGLWIPSGMSLSRTHSGAFTCALRARPG